MVGNETTLKINDGNAGNIDIYSGVGNLNLQTLNIYGDCQTIALSAGDAGGIAFDGSLIRLGDNNDGVNGTKIIIDDTGVDIKINCVAKTSIGDGINGGALTGYTFLIDADTGGQYFTSNGGQASKCDEITALSVQIEKKMNFITTDVDVELKKSNEYLNELGGGNGEGWFCYIQNISITSAASEDFVNNTITPTYTLSKYSTRRFTLTYWTTNGKYYWSVL